MMVLDSWQLELAQVIVKTHGPQLRLELINTRQRSIRAVYSTKFPGDTIMRRLLCQML